jgi:prepilin-type N-terminal cleavage/methylation domain-containing protein
MKIFTNKKTNKNIKTASKKGFSLVEVLMAIFIFSLLVTMVSGSFASFFKVYLSQKKSQNDLENAQYALNLMEKTIRTSVVKTDNMPSGNLDFANIDNKRIKLFDNSQNKCIVYIFSQNAIKVSTKYGAGVTSIDDCGDFTGGYSAPDDLTSADIYNVSVYGNVSTGTKAGRITVSLEVGQASPIYVQMTTSLRDFTKVVVGACGPVSSPSDLVPAGSLDSSSPGLCAGGTVINFNAATYSYSWSCQGTDGGSPDNCSVNTDA